MTPQEAIAAAEERQRCAQAIDAENSSDHSEDRQAGMAYAAGICRRLGPTDSLAEHDKLIAAEERRACMDIFNSHLAACIKANNVAISPDDIWAEISKRGSQDSLRLLLAKRARDEAKVWHDRVGPNHVCRKPPFPMPWECQRLAQHDAEIAALEHAAKSEPKG